MNDKSARSFSFIKALSLIGLATIAALVILALLLIRTPTTIPPPDSNKQFVAVNIATSYLQRLQAEQSITEPTYFEDRLTINEQLYKIEVMGVTTEHPNMLSITVNVFSVDHQVEGAAEGYVEISHAQNET